MTWNFFILLQLHGNTEKMEGEEQLEPTQTDR